ncbi:hypothetical protein HPT27_11315 [Permianibacter sp. IMCC34836]|uniref:hypothetical protein n=1 Tax=Permianibacter fluminis TaxID=2738515 RepID=UPI00155293A3|nr:hypothetical protein [Permianibacter fluminis]NQD37615.1 hypothetical protein [Permianibacter fluminis]
MKLKATVAFCLTLISSAFAEEGLVVHLTIKKSAGERASTYTNGVLMRQTEAVTMTFPNEYEMRLESEAIGKDEVNIVVTLKDITSDKPIYAGSGAVTLKVGSSATVPFHQLEAASASYEIFLDTSYGQLPETAN